MKDKLDSMDHFICQNQANLFLLAQKEGYDIIEFIAGFMNSRFANVEWDAPNTYCQTATPEYNLVDCIEEFDPPKSDVCFDEPSVDWIGYMYRYIQIRLGIHSKEILQVLPVRNMLIWYEGMHTLSEEYFIEDVVKEKLAS